MVAQIVEKADHIAAQLCMLPARHRESLPDSSSAAGVAVWRCEAFDDLDRACDWSNRHPLGFFAASVPRLVSNALDSVSFDHRVCTFGYRVAAETHRLQLAIAHAGQIGTYDIRGGQQHPFLFEEAALVEPRSPRQACVGISRDGTIHATNLRTEAFDGAYQSSPERWAADQKASVAAELKRDQMKVDVGVGPVAVSLRSAAAIMLRDRNPASLSATAANVGVNAIEECWRRLTFVAMSSIQFKRLILVASAEDVRREVIDVLQRPTQQRSDDGLRNTGCAVVGRLRSWR